MLRFLRFGGGGKRCHMLRFLEFGNWGTLEFGNLESAEFVIFKHLGKGVTCYGFWVWREEGKVSHVTVSGVWREEGKGVTCYGFWGIALLCLVLYMDSNLYPTIT